MPQSRIRSPRTVSPVAAILAALIALTPAHADTAPQMIGGEPVVEVAAGGYHTCARVQSGAVWCWGANWHGQLGNGTTANRRTPVRVRGLSNVTAIAAGFASTCALRETGRVFCWGRNDRGQLGDGTTTDRATPVRVEGLARVRHLTVGDAHACAIRTVGRYGRAFCWGANDEGQLGDGSLIDRSTPEAPVTRRTSYMLAGGRINCMYDAMYSNLVICWGRWPGSQPVLRRPIPNTERYRGFAVGHDHACAFGRLSVAENHVYCWGRNDYGQLGQGHFDDVGFEHVQVPGLDGVTDLALGWYHTCALRRTGRVFCWGLNAAGQLGDRTTESRASPGRVAGPLATNAVQITVGIEHSCLLDAEGRVACWGDNDFGQLGDGTTTDRLAPVRVRR